MTASSFLAAPKRQGLSSHACPRTKSVSVLATSSNGSLLCSARERTTAPSVAAIVTVAMRMRSVFGHAADDEEFGELFGPGAEDGADVVEDVDFGSGHGDGDDRAPRTELRVVEERLPEGEEALEDLKSALSTGRLHRLESPPAGPIECRVEQLGLTSREVVVHRSSRSVCDAQDLLERRPLNALGGQENHCSVDHVGTYVLAWAHSFSSGTRNRRSPSRPRHYAQRHSSWLFYAGRHT